MELGAVRRVDRTSQTIAEAHPGPSVLYDCKRRDDLISASGVPLGAAVMVFSLVAYFCSMVTAFAVVMVALVGFGDSQLRTNRTARYPAVSVLAGSDSDALTNSGKAREEQKAAEARKVLEAQRAAEKAAEAKENAKKLARARLARERKEAMIARARQERRNSLAFGSAEQQFPGGAGLYSYAPGLSRQ
jgi:hypothetical protein